MTTKDRLLVRTKRAFRHMTPRHIVKSRITSQVVRNFAEKVGMVYFGYVNQKSDDHRMVRGHTVSATHTDNHYCMGTLRGYDAIIVSRNDVIRARNKTKTEKRCHWLICVVDLHTKTEVPHLYVGHSSRDEAFHASYEQLRPIDLGIHAAYPPHFLNDYTVYGIATDGIEIEQTITPQVADVISHHFTRASIEIEDNTIYVYIESQFPDEQVLEKTLSNALWLADTIDNSFTSKTIQ
ncbi:hypothetical protein EOL96_00640 [Candidatus Saccharibacteria bacterium]|nr:hypothetical protein [Candidatus Saccharibacteria bacterium]